MRLVTVKMPEMYLEGLDELVKAGKFTTRSEAIRIAVRELLKRELWMVVAENYYEYTPPPMVVEKKKITV